MKTIPASDLKTYAGGSAGADGDDGVGGLPYTFSTTTTDSDPGAGVLRLNNGTLGSVSEIYIDDSTAAAGNPDVSAFILTWDDSTQTSDRGQITIAKKSAQQNFAIYKISGASTDASGYVKLAVTHVVSNGSFSNTDDLLVSFARTGDAGSLADPMTTRGDIIFRNSSNATARLAVGAANRVLISDGTDPSYGQVPLASAVSGTLPIANGGTGSTSAADARTAIGAEAADADILKADTADVLTAGFAASVHDLGTISSGTTTLDEANGNLQKCVNGGAFTLAPPSNSCTIVLQVTNNASAGSVTTSGFTLTDGDTISTGNGDDFFFYVTVVGSFSHLTVKKLS
tara:strand:- start:338 stop:1366 length:1029 start_codon:yes stop_codon:yes gene_type:complete